jgi:hypothetical protein
MENHISLSPSPVLISYLKHFQVAQKNLHLNIREEKLRRQRRKFKESLQG